MNRWRDELGPTVRLAGPIVLGQLGLMSMALVDTAVVGRLGPTAVAASGVAHAVFFTSFLFGLGLVLGLDRSVAYAVGAGRRGEVAGLYWHGLLISLVAGVVLTFVSLGLAHRIEWFGLDPAVAAGAQTYLSVLAFSILPSLLFTAARQALQGLGETRVSTVVMLAANGVNLGANLWFVPGGAGVPAMGIAGSAAATVLSRTLMALVLCAYAFHRLGRPDTFRPQRKPMAELWRLGWPAGVQMVFEGGVFSLTNLLAAKLGPVPGAASQVVLQIASFTFMLPLGVAGASSVRVGQYLGEGRPEAARRAGNAAVALSMVVMTGVGLALVLLAQPVMQLFGQPSEVVEVGRQLLLCAGLFQLADGAQVTLAGILRGSGETVSAMVANLCGHWLVGLPLGALLCYRLGWGAAGLWTGLATGLVLVALGLGTVWRRRIARLCRVDVKVS